MFLETLVKISKHPKKSLCWHAKKRRAPPNHPNALFSIGSAIRQSYNVRTVNLLDAKPKHQIVQSRRVNRCWLEPGKRLHAASRCKCDQGGVARLRPTFSKPFKISAAHPVQSNDKPQSCKWALDKPHRIRKDLAYSSLPLGTLSNIKRSRRHASNLDRCREHNWGASPRTPCDDKAIAIWLGKQVVARRLIRPHAQQYWQLPCSLWNA